MATGISRATNALTALAHFEATLDFVRTWKQRDNSANSNGSASEIAEKLAKLESEFQQFGAIQKSFGVQLMDR